MGSEVGEDMPDLDDSDVENATIKIQSAFRGFQARKNIVKSKPSFKKQKFEDIVHAAIVIQRTYRRYKKRKEDRRKSAKMDGQRKTKKRNLAEVALAAVTIQRAYRRYKMKNIVKRKSKCQPQELSGKSQR